MNLYSSAFQFLRKVLHRFGLDIVRIGDQFRMDVYERLYKKEELESPLFYNIGAGSFFHPHWVNIDYVSPWYGPVQRKNVKHHDLMSLAPLPIESSTAHIVYTSHTIEHISAEAVGVLFREVYRCLKSGGIFRITTGPDAETDYRALRLADEDWFFWDKRYIKKGSFEHLFRAAATSVPLHERWLHHVASQLAPNDISPSADKLDSSKLQKLFEIYGFPGVLNVLESKCKFNAERPGNHISWWTHDRIIKLLETSGFETIYRSGYRQSVSPLMRQSDLFDSTHPQMSIYVEAIKH